MPVEKIYWSWTEAFDKFGFDDGDGLVRTDEVADFLESLGYKVATNMWGIHNTVIDTLIAPDGTELIVDGEIKIEEGYKLGYDEADDYLPDDLVEKLYEAFPDVNE